MSIFDKFNRDLRKIIPGGVISVYTVKDGEETLAMSSETTHDPRFADVIIQNVKDGAKTVFKYQTRDEVIKEALDYLSQFTPTECRLWNDDK